MWDQPSWKENLFGRVEACAGDWKIDVVIQTWSAPARWKAERVFSRLIDYSFLFSPLLSRAPLRRNNWQRQTFVWTVWKEILKAGFWNALSLNTPPPPSLPTFCALYDPLPIHTLENMTTPPYLWTPPPLSSLSTTPSPPLPFRPLPRLASRGTYYPDAPFVLLAGRQKVLLSVPLDKQTCSIAISPLQLITGHMQQPCTTHNTSHLTLPPALCTRPDAVYLKDCNASNLMH